MLLDINPMFIHLPGKLWGRKAQDKSIYVVQALQASYLKLSSLQVHSYKRTNKNERKQQIT